MDLATEMDEKSFIAKNTAKITINNIICKFFVNCTLDLQKVAQNCVDVEYKPQNNLVTMKIRKPSSTANIWSSGKVVCLGTTSEIEAKMAARRFGRCIQKIGYNVSIRNFSIANVFGTANFPFEINLTNLANQLQNETSIEQLQYRLKCKLRNYKASVNIYYTGSITISAPSEENVQKSLETISKLILKFKMNEFQEQNQTDTDMEV